MNHHELLRTFIAAVNSPTFAVAATRRHLTKSAVSQQIKALEAQLGVTLFERVGRGARPTARAIALATTLERALASVDDALESAARLDAEVQGPLRIGAPEPLARAFLRPRIAQLLATYPALRVELSFDSPGDLERKLASDALDLTLLVRRPAAPGIVAKRLFTETFVAVASPAYLTAHGTPRSVRDMASQRFLTFDENMPVHAAWWRAAFGARTPFNGFVCARIPNVEELLELSCAGAGIVVLPDYVVTDALQHKRLRRVLPPAGRSEPQNTVYLAWRKSAERLTRTQLARAMLARDPSAVSA